jgi:hypothetical protein
MTTSLQVPDIKTKKAAREAGLRTREEWLRGWPPTAVRLDATPVIVKGAEYFRDADCEELVSKAEAGRRGLLIADDAVPAKMIYSDKFKKHYDVYRISDCIAKRKIAAVAPSAIDLLRAIFTVNKAAKRYRDAAQGQYQRSVHGFAQNSRQRKELLYRVKDRGISAAYCQGRLQFVGTHGGLALYRGEGYCFHSCLVPKNAEALQDQPQERVFIEAAPKEAKEARLKDAMFTLQDVSGKECEFTRLEQPRHPKEPKLEHESDDDDDDQDDDPWNDGWDDDETEL